MFPFKWIREKKWQSESAQVFALEMNPELIVPAVSVQPEWRGGRGIIRGVKDNGNLAEDFIDQEINAGKLEDAGRRISGADEMRQHVWTVGQHKADFAKQHPHEKIVAWVGNGNLLSNPHFVGYSGGAILHLSQETPYLATRWYSSLVVWKSGSARRVTIESIRYENRTDGIRVFSKDGSDITDKIECATFGQQLVLNGQPIDTARLKELAAQGQFYDLRHLFLFGRIPMGEKRWLDAGLAAFWGDDGQMKKQSLEDAIDGRPITLDAGQFNESQVHEAMDAKGFDLVEDQEALKEAGQYSLKNGKLSVTLLGGLYPHNMIAVKKDGTVLSVVLRGLSNRVGVTICGAAEILTALGAEDALLLDNGGDVMMSFQDVQVLGSAEGERNRLRSLVLFRSVADPAKLQARDFRLVTYPKQFVSA